MFYAATDNLCIVGYKVEMAAFESKDRRDKMVAGSNFHAISAEEAKNHEAYCVCRDYPESIFDNDKKMTGMVFFTYGGVYGGEFHSISR